MKKLYCDICGKPIKFDDKWNNYKVKRLDTSFGEKDWDRLDVHDECWRELCNLIKQKKLIK